ncbi:MAG TPA: carboxymuconolactone decarboxylase family protein [Xanthobacteraceae bacterium]
MRGKLMMTGALGALAGVACMWAASVFAAPEFQLRGGRFRPLAYAELSPAQKVLADAALASGRKSLDGPLNITLRSPEMAELSRGLDAYLRFDSTAVPHKFKEIAIMLTARFWGGQYVWYSHRQQALDSGLSAAFIDAMAAGARPADMSADEAIVLDFCEELLATRQVSDAHFKAMAERFGERGIVELIGLMGRYHALTMLFAVDRYPLPEGAREAIDRPK